MSVLEELGIRNLIDSDLRLICLDQRHHCPVSEQIFIHFSDLKPRGRRISGWGETIKEATLAALARESLYLKSVKTTHSFENIRPQSNIGLNKITLEDL
jgi:hypothetical protein